MNLDEICQHGSFVRSNYRGVVYVQGCISDLSAQRHSGDADLSGLQGAQHVVMIENLHPVVGLAEAADREKADDRNQDDQHAEAKQQPGSCIEILKPVHGRTFLFPLGAVRANWMGKPGPPRPVLLPCCTTENKFNSESAVTSTMGATQPSPRMVAPIIPSTLFRFFSRLFTTTCCCPSSSSITRPIFLRPASTTTTRRSSSTGSAPGSSPSRGTPRNRHRRSTGIDSSRMTTTSPCSARRTILPLAGTASTTASSGSTNVRSATRTSRPSRIARVSGNSIDTVDPLPSSLASPTVPLSCCTLRLTTSIPTPRPERSLTSSRVENPGAKISILI